MKIKFYKCFGIIVVIPFLFCSSFTVHDKREGIIKDKNTIRVMVRIERYNDEGEKNVKKAEEELLIAAKKRFNDIVQAYVTVLKGKENADDLELQLSKKEKPPYIVYRNFTEETIYAYVDFPVGEKVTQILTSFEYISSVDNENDK